MERQTQKILTTQERIGITLKVGLRIQIHQRIDRRIVAQLIRPIALPGQPTGNVLNRWMNG